MTLELIAPAKLTLSLRITGVRADGFHLIDAEMVSLSIHDRLTVDPAGTGLAAAGRYGVGVPLDERNLVAKALRLAGVDAHVTIHKNIPHGGGLGGGSSDAAAVLRWAGVDDPELAATIGADVAFCLRGGRARVTGIGEIIEPLPHRHQQVTLIIPPIAVSTPAAYRMWDALGAPNGDGPNDLEPAAIALEPELGVWRDRIGEACGEPPVLAGSGATWFVLGEHSNALAGLSDEGAEIVSAHAVPSA